MGKAFTHAAAFFALLLLYFPTFLPYGTIRYRQGVKP